MHEVELARSWSAVTTHLRRSYRLRLEEPTFVGMVWSFTLGRLTLEQQLKVDRIDDWIVVRATVCRSEEIDPIAILRSCTPPVIGALVLSEHFCFLRALQPLATVLLDELDRDIRFVAREAARLAHRRKVETATVSRGD